MFENLIAQPASGLLIDDITAGRLPPSMLFSGGLASGKLTAALELARILSCHDGRALWSCVCSSCLRHKELAHPDLLLMGPRDCILEIRASSTAFTRSRTPASRYLFLRSVRKLTLRFNPAIQDQGDARYSRAAPLLAELEERLEELSPSRPLPGETATLEKNVAAIVNSSERLEDEFLYDSIPVNQVRNATAWARLTPSDRKKVLVIENADRMLDASRNAFLKVLEEPPSDVVFILTTSRRGAIMPTILSRVRTYAFVDRPEVTQGEVITRVFHDAPRGGELLPAYFNRFLPVAPEAIAVAARLYLNMVLVAALDEGRRPLTGMRFALDSGEESARLGADVEPSGRGAETDPGAVTVSAIVAMLNKCKPGIVYRLFLSTIARFMRDALRADSVDSRESSCYARWTTLIRDALDAVDVYNVSPQSALERLAQGMRDAL